MQAAPLAEQVKYDLGAVCNGKIGPGVLDIGNLIYIIISGSFSGQGTSPKKE